jgi:2-oxoglutarate ferredoxin oxidoreductase subunit alpha
MFALGLLYWLYGRNMETTINFLKKKFATKPEIVEANKKAISAGFNYGETIEAIKTTFKVSRAKFDKGTYRNIMGNHATALGLLAAAENADLDLFYGGYPITPATDILHYLSGYKQFGVKTFQAEDEIAGIVSTIGASFAGNLAVTATSGPGLALKSEAMGLAVMTELPIVIINVQRGGPSTGLPTKTEQSDLFQAMYNRNGEAPLVVLAAATPADGFHIAYEASRLALKYMIPVVVLSDGYIANGSEPWKVPNMADLPKIITQKVDGSKPVDTFNHNNDLLARPWATPGTPNLEHRIGGLEKQDVSGNVNYEPSNHQYMVELRQKKIDIIANDIPNAKVFGKESGDLLVVGWGGTHGAIRSAVEKAQTNGLTVSHLHLRNINPFPKNLGDILVKFQKVLVPELNLGQLTTMLRAKYLVDAVNFGKVQGKPFTSSEILHKINKMVKG